MSDNRPENYAMDLTADNDRKNLIRIANALANGQINQETADYLNVLYSDGMDRFRDVFHILGKCFGAPKAAVSQYDYVANTAVPGHVKISDINPLSPYIVHHRLDADPMRNQFFKTGDAHKIDLSVSSIVTVIVAAQKNIERSIEKITGKYYSAYVDAVANTICQIFTNAGMSDKGAEIAKRVRAKFASEFITTASETVLGLIGPGHEKLAVELIRALDRIVPPYMCLQDVWRVKCLFDLIPQARTFIERIQDMMPDCILSLRDTFYSMDNPRNYRDAKIVINIGTTDRVIPMEIICQVRTFFEFEHKTHIPYERVRSVNDRQSHNIEKRLANFLEDGIKEYNMLICRCVEDLFERTGWNILYSQGKQVSMFDGFPKKCKMYYPHQIIEKIEHKIDNAVQNEVFHFCDAPSQLTQAQEIEIFRFMAHFILVSSIPYLQTGWSVPSDTLAGRFFNFVMAEVQRYI